MTGATVAHELAQAGKFVMVIERRGHIAGNCYDKLVRGIRVSCYGGHIFHTNSKRVWNFARQFTEIEQYEHRVKASIRGKLYPFPPNKLTAQMLGLNGQFEQYLELFYKGFSEKAWGRPWSEIPEAIRARVPLRSNWDDRYFTDRYQGLPMSGYTDMVGKMLDGIPVELGTDFCRDYDYWRGRARRVIYTGALDELMEERFGRLEYRSLKFETKFLEADDFQGCPTVNYPQAEIPHTVVNEWKHYGWKSEPRGVTAITKQTPASFEETGERFYPFVDDENRKKHAQYMSALEAGIIPAGRLGRFQYLNMDQAIAGGLALAERLCSCR